MSNFGISTNDTTGLTSLNRMFSGNTNVTKIVFYDDFDTSNVTDMRYMFYGCTSLTSTNVSRFDTLNATMLEGMFNGCNRLTSLDLTNFVTPKVKFMANMFPSSLKKLLIPNFDYSNIYSFLNLPFNSSSSMSTSASTDFETVKSMLTSTSKSIPSYSGDKLWYFNSGYYYLMDDEDGTLNNLLVQSTTLGWSIYNLKLIPYETNQNIITYTTTNGTALTKTPTTNATLTSNTYVDGLGTLTYSDNITKTSSEVFKGNSYVKTLTFPKTFSYIGSASLANLTSLESIDIDNVMYIDMWGLQGCTALTSLTLGENIKYINSYAFERLTGLQSLTVKATTPPTLSKNAFNQFTPTFPIYVPSESVDAYKSASNWSTYADLIQAIPTE